MGYLKSIKDKIQNQFYILSLGLANVEKNALSNTEKEGLESNTSMHQTVQQSQLMNSLIRGEVTEEVEMLRARMYMVLDAAQKKKIKGAKIKRNINKDDGVSIESVDKDGNIINSDYEIEEVEIGDVEDYKSQLVGIRIDNYDNYPLELFIDNSEISTADWDDIIFKNNTIRPVECQREEGKIPKFLIEKYATALLVRTISETKKLIEFRFSKYPDCTERKSVLLTSELRKLNDKTLNKSNITDIKSIYFITSGCIGADDRLLFEYDVVKFDKVVEFEEFYIVKFICNVVTNGYNIVEDYKNEKMQAKYDNNEPRPNVLNPNPIILK